MEDLNFLQEFFLPGKKWVGFSADRTIGRFLVEWIFKSIAIFVYKKVGIDSTVWQTGGRRV